VLAGIGVDLGAVETDRAKPRESVLSGYLQDLDKRRFELGAKPGSEVGQRVVIRGQVAGDITKLQGIVGGSFDLAAGKGPGGVAVDQQRQ
jgi:hypothetical protein